MLDEIIENTPVKISGCEYWAVFFKEIEKVSDGYHSFEELYRHR